MKSTPDEVLTRFASRLACEYYTEQRTPVAPSASSLPSCLSPSDDAETCCSFPCLSLKPPSSRCHTAYMDKDEASQLRRIMRMNEKTVTLAPATLLRNVLRSFGLTLEERLLKSIFSLMEHNAQEEASRYSSDSSSSSSSSYDEKKEEFSSIRRREKISAALVAFSSSNVSPIAPIAATTNFFTIPDANYYNNLAQQDEETKGGTTTIVVPLQFQASVDVRILGKETATAAFGASGTITGVFTSKKNRPDSVVVDIDTNELFKSIKRQCRTLVKQAVDSVFEDVEIGMMRPPHIKSIDRTRSLSHDSLSMRSISNSL